MQSGEQGAGHLLTADELVERVATLNVNVHKGRRAAHKPLLLLWALARFKRGEERFPFADVEPEVGSLLETFGPPYKTSADYPFWHLQSDGLWVVEEADLLPPGKGQTKPLITTLRKREAAGHFDPDVEHVLRDQPYLVGELIGVLLGYFPRTYDADLLQAVGLDGEGVPVSPRPLKRSAFRRPRDPHFRERVLDAYNAQCAVCGFSAKVGSALAGVEAAHIRWHSEDGPDTTENGLALCSIHHTLFDRGAFTLSDEYEPRVSVAQRARGRGLFDAILLDAHGRPASRPRSDEDAPGQDFLRWHRQEVFRSPARS